MLDPVTAIEEAMIARLRSGLGKMVSEVASYTGELDEDLPAVVRRFPAAWVTFGGISKTDAISTSREKLKATGNFVVMVGCRNLQGGSAARHGHQGIGTNQLVIAVRKLLACQDLGLEISQISPGKVRTLYNTRIEKTALQVYACEFETAWIEPVLANGANPSADDVLYAGYGGTVSSPEPEVQSINLSYSVPPSKATSISDVVTLEEKP